MNLVQEVATRTEYLATPEEWSHFVSGFVDELKTPLSNLGTLAELIGGAEQREIGFPVEQLTGSLRQLVSELQITVDDVKSLIRLARAGPRLSLRDVVVRDVLDRVEDRLRSRAWERGVTISAVEEPGLPATVNTDPEVLLSGLVHLLGTVAALAESEVELRVGTCDGDLIFAVKPDGGCSAVRPDEALRDPFGSSSARALRERGGRSLAMVLAREQARLLGGDLTFVEGEPSRCELRIPLHREPVSAPL